jgi:hypothetical protein
MGLKERRSERLLKQQGIVDIAKRENRDMTAEEQREFDDLQREIGVLDELIASEDGSAGQEGIAGRTDLTSNNQRLLEEENKRCVEITELCKAFGQDGKTAEYLRSNKTVEDVQGIILKKLKDERIPIGARVIVGEDAQDKYVRAMADAILMRQGITVEKPEDGATSLMGMGLVKTAIECLAKADGDDYRKYNQMSESELFEQITSSRAYFNPANAFPSIMDEVINKAYVAGHNRVPVTFDRWTKKGSLSDFKAQKGGYLVGTAGEFLELPEGAEIKHDVPTDSMRPERRLRTYARQFSMTREAFVNDDIGFLTTVPARYAESARKTINKQCYQVLANNPVIYDGIQLFDKNNHKNILASGTGIDRESIQKMLFAMQLQTDEFGEAIIIRPSKIIVPVGYRFDMYELFFSERVFTSGNTQAVNPLYPYRNMEVIEDVTLNILSDGGNIPWFLVAEPSDAEFLQVDYLNGQELPTIRRMEQAGQLGFVWDMYLDWGITVTDYRGIVKNPGIAVQNPLD